MMPIISVVVPCYNQAQYLDECLQSVLDQTYIKWECLIINDGSPDNTAEIAKKWIEKDSRFKYYTKENGGVSAARNFGIEKAIGEWILPLDADDKISDNYLTLASNYFYRNVDIIYCKAKYFGDKNGEIKLPAFNSNLILLKNQIFCSALFKKEDCITINGFDELMHDGFEDWEFWIRLIQFKGKKINVKMLDYFGFSYRIKEISRNSTAMKDKSADIKKFIFSKHKDFYHNNLLEFSNHINDYTAVQEQLNYYKNSKSHRLVNKILRVYYIIKK